MVTIENYYGIDISKLSFDVVDNHGKHKEYSNCKKGFSKFIKQLKPNSICLMEVTGIYHLNLANYLYSKKIPVSVVNPLQIKRFSQMHLRKNKTDKADAQMICKYAQEQKYEQWKPEAKEITQVKDMIQVIEQYKEFRAGLRNKLSGLNSKQGEKFLIESVKNQIETITKSIKELEVKVEVLIKEYDKVMLSNISSVVGIGKATASLLIATTEGFKGFVNVKQVSSYFGIAPTELKSGTSINGSRKISKMGNPLVRKKLYMCSLQASRYNPSCMQLYARLLAKGKPKKLALIAVANKLLKICFAIAKSGLPYDREYVSGLERSSKGIK
jgi:transposase